MLGGKFGAHIGRETECSWGPKDRKGTEYAGIVPSLGWRLQDGLYPMQAEKGNLWEIETVAEERDDDARTCCRNQQDEHGGV